MAFPNPPPCLRRPSANLLQFFAKTFPIPVRQISKVTINSIYSSETFCLAPWCLFSEAKILYHFCVFSSEAGSLGETKQFGQKVTRAVMNLMGARAQRKA